MRRPQWMRTLWGRVGQGHRGTARRGSRLVCRRTGRGYLVRTSMRSRLLVDSAAGEVVKGYSHFDVAAGGDVDDVLPGGLVERLPVLLYELHGPDVQVKGGGPSVRCWRGSTPRRCQALTVWSTRAGSELSSVDGEDHGAAVWSGRSTRTARKGIPPIGDHNRSTSTATQPAAGRGRGRGRSFNTGRPTDGSRLVCRCVRIAGKPPVEESGGGGRRCRSELVRHS